MLWLKAHYFDLLKAFHLIALVCWFAGIFYLPRLFVYHALASEQATREHLKIMERKLYRFVTPFAVITIALGIAMVLQNPQYYAHATWLKIKVLLVLLLAIYHWQCGRLVRRFAADGVRQGHVYFRWFNELPVFLLFGIIILAVVKPF